MRERGGMSCDANCPDRIVVLLVRYVTNAAEGHDGNVLIDRIKLRNSAASSVAAKRISAIV